MAVDSLGQLTVDLVANTGGFEAGMDRAQRALKSATKEAAYQAGQLDKLVGKIDPVVGAYGRLDKMEEQLRAHRKAGRLDTREFDDYLKKLNQQRDALGLTDKALAKNSQQFAANGQTVKQYQNNLRNLPAQFTDITGSLQAGQAPLTVFLQQGGQLRDMFGGIGPAAKALSGYVAGLINPLTVSAAAVAALGAAYYQGSNEATAYNAALAATGNFAGTSADTLATMAKQVSQATGTVGAAAEVLTALAASGKIAVGSFDQIAVAALRTQQATGKAATEVVADFVKIAEDPLKAILKLNEGMNFLTETTYSQIKAFTEQGDAASAAATANTAYSDALNGVADKVQDNLGYIESAWKIVKGAAKGAWDAMLNVGRDQTLDAAIQEAQTALDRIAETRSANKTPGNGVVFIDSTREQEAQRRLTDLLIQRDEKNRRESSARIYAQQRADALGAAQDIDKIHEGFASKEEQRDKARAEYLSKIDKLQAGVQNGSVQASDPRLNAERIAADLDGIDAKYAEKKAARTKAYVEDAGTKELDQAKQQYAVLMQQSQQLDEQTGKLKALGPAQQELIKWEQELADIKEKKTLTAAQKSLLATADQITAQKTVNAELEKDTQARKESADQQKQLNEFTQAQADALSRFQQGLDNQVVGIGLGAEGRKRLQDDLALQNDYANQVERLRRDKIAGRITQDTYDKETEILKDTLDKQLQAYRDNYAKIDAARAQWQNGMTAALQDYSYEASDIAGQTYALVMDGAHGLEDAFADAATSGKLSFRSLIDSVIADLARMAAKVLIVQPLLSALFGGNGGGATSGLGSLVSGGGSGGGIVGLLTNVKNVVSVAGSNFGKALISGWNSGDGVLGGLQTAFTNGADYLGSTITSAFSTGSSTAAQVASNYGASVAAGSSIEGYTGAQFSSYVATQNAASSLSALSATLSYVGAVYAVIQSYQAYGAKGAATTAGFAAAGAAIGSIVPVIGTALGAAIGAVIGSFVSSKAFGSGEKYADLSTSATGRYINGTYTDTGVQQGWQTKAPKFGSQVDSIMSSNLNKFSATLGMLYDTLGNGADVVAYNLLQVRKTSGKYSGSYGAQLDDGSVLEFNNQYNAADAAAALTANYDNLMGTFLAKAIVSSKSLPDYFKAQFTEFASDWDATADEVIKTIEGVFTRFNGVNDALTLINVNNLKLDETGLIASDSILNMIGAMSDLDTTTASAKEKVEALNTAVGTYYQAFFSADEQFADLTESLKKAFGSFGLDLPDNRAAYRDMVEDIDVTTAAGQAMFATLVGLAKNADSYYSTLDKQAQAALQSLMDGANSAFSALQRSINAQKTSINDMLQTASTNVSDLTTVGNSLSSALKSLKGDSADTVTMLRAQAQATLQNALAQARAGKSLAGFEGLDDALSVVSSNKTDLYATFEDFARDQGRSAALIDELNTLNGKQLTNAEKTVKSLQDQLTRLDEQLAFAQSQLDALNNVDNSIMDVTKAVNAMNAAVVAALAGGRGTTDSNSAILQAYQATYGSSYTPDAAGFQYWQNQIASGALTTAQLAEAIRNAAAANGTLPKFAKGTNNWDGSPALVGEFGPEIVTANNLGGSTIYPAQRSRSLLNAGAGDDEAERATENWREKLMKKVNEVARNLALLDKWDADGMPKVRA